jgi:P27 family predicted phage terminase small subunit
MAKTGPKPKPTKLKVLGGETRRSRINADEPQPLGAPEPGDLDPEALEVWHRVMRAMPEGVITAADHDILRAYCRAVVRYEQADRLMRQTGPLIRGKAGQLVKNPAGVIARLEAQLVVRLAAELGLTPSARAGLRPMVAESDPFEEYLKRRKAYAS